MVVDLTEFKPRWEAAKQQGWTERQAIDACLEGRLPFIKVGREVWVRPADIQALIDAAYVPAKVGPLADTRQG